MKNKYQATLIGVIFSIPGLSLVVISLLPELAAIAVVIMIITFMPIALPLEFIGEFIFSQYSYVALMVLLVLLLSLALLSTIYFKRVITLYKKQSVFRVWELVGYFIALSCILHPLVYYVWAFLNSENAGDGQFIFGTFQTLPISSGIFLMISVAIDIVKNNVAANTA